MFVVMISFDDIPEIYIVKNVTDLRKEIDGYASIVQDALFIFCNKHRNKIKCMYWDGNGFWLLYKRLEKGRFQFPIRDDGIATITKQQLRWLLEGLRMEQKKLLKTSYINTHKMLYLQSFYAHLWYNTYVW
ncbi:IS66 family insertion sequence element accessory protein TnpB [Holdemanella sp.]|uniref:IS66 family insertion sequence element accessory protein TnpB n=1 Tax=Holdemanella sp. TaxID=1971762 RepID=UPI0025830B7C|nr:IS66 family insertion sequence element accessory protein TnpB [Holdemanella sp.]